MEMRLVEGPTMRPHTCVDGSQSGPVVDTMLTHFAYGRMYWSRRLVVEAGRLYGLVDAETHAAVLGAVSELELKVAALEGELAELQPVRDAIQRFQVMDPYVEPGEVGVQVATSAPSRRKAAA